MRRLAQLIGGDVAVVSTPDEGSRFTVTLRLRAADAPEFLAETALNTGMGAPVRRAGVDRLLVADDHPVNLEVMSRQLECLGLEADVAEDGAAALDLWRQHRHTVVLLDLHMPTLDGFGLAEAIRREEAAQNVPRTGLIAVTADVLKGEDARCFASGMDGFLPKPVSLDALARTIARWIPDVAPSGGGLDIAVGALFDPEALRGMFGADMTRLASLLQTFCKSAARDVVAIREASDAAVLAAAAHRLKGAAGIVGARLLAEHASRVEAAARAGELATAHDAADDMEAVFSDTLRAMPSVV